MTWYHFLFRSRSPLILEDVEADEARLRAHVRVPDGGEEVDLRIRFLKQCSCRTYRRRLERILGWEVDFLKQVMSCAPFEQQTYKLKRAALVGAASGPADASREQAHILRRLDEYAVLLQLNMPTAKCQGARQAAHLRAGGDLAAFTLHPHLSDVRHGCRTEQLGFRVPENTLVCKRRKRFGSQANLVAPLVNEKWTRI